MKGALKVARETVLALAAFILVTIPGCTGKVNQQPTICPIENRIVGLGYKMEMHFQASDPENDPLSFRVENLPFGASFASSPPVITWTPQRRGIFSGIKIMASDGHTEVSKSFSIDVRAMPSTIKGPQDGEAIMNVIYYGDHTPEVDSRILGSKPEYIIANPPHGLWGELSGDEIFTGISQYQKTGIKVIGYITAGYEGTSSGGDISPKWYSLETNLRLIRDMANVDKVDGVFIDECSSFPDANSKQYLLSLTTLAHSLGLMTWGNVGVASFDSWYFTDGGFDLMQSNEDWHGQELTQVQREWGYRISVSGLYTELSAKAAFDLTSDAKEKGLAYCYICASYHMLPDWFEQYVDLLVSS